MFAHGRPHMLRRIAIKDVSGHRFLRGDRFQQLIQADELVLRKCFSGKEIKNTSIWIGKRLLNRGQVVAQGLTAGCTGGDNQILSVVSSFKSFSLMRIKLRYPKCLQSRVKARIQRGGDGRTDRFTGCGDLPVRNVFTKFLVLLPAINQRADASITRMLERIIFQVGLSFLRLETPAGP